MLIKLGLTLIRIQSERRVEREERRVGRERERERERERKTETQKGKETSDRIRTGKVTPAASLIAVSFDPWHVARWLMPQLDGYVWMHHIWNIRGRAASDLYWSISAKGGSRARMSNSVNFPVSLCVHVSARRVQIAQHASYSAPFYKYMWAAEDLEKTTTHSPLVVSSARAVHSGLWGRTHAHNMSGRHILETKTSGRRSANYKSAFFFLSQIHALYIMSLPCYCNLILIGHLPGRPAGGNMLLEVIVLI